MKANKKKKKKKNGSVQQSAFVENYFNYSPSYSDNPEKNISTTSSLISSTAASTATCHARRLTAAHSHKLSATLGGSTSTRPRVRKITIKTYDFIGISNTTIPIVLRGSTTTSPPIVIVILRQQIDYIIVDYAAPTMPHPIKAKFPLPKVDYSLFTAPNTRGLRHEKSSCISLTSKNCESPSSWLAFLVEYLTI
jgi:hypothetical protein